MTNEQATTARPRAAADRSMPGSGDDLRQRSLAGVPAGERRLELAGISTPVLEGGEGAPVVLLHGPSGNATHWVRTIEGLVPTHRVIAPDLPGHGESELGNSEPTADRVLAWLGELIEQTCDAPPILVGYALGGGIAARFAVDQSQAIAGLVLVDALGLRAFEPAPEFGRALNEFLAAPDERTYESLWRRCAHDLDRVRERMGERREPFEAYNIDRAQTPSVQAAGGALMGEFALQAIPPADLERITAPTTLIWGRHDLATALEKAEAVSARHGWPLRVTEDCADDPPIEQPEAFVRTLREALGGA